MKEVVIDASVAVKWVVAEDYSANAPLLLEYDTVQAPAHWRAEAVNVLRAKVFRGDLTATDAEERMLVLNRAPVVDAAIAGLVIRLRDLAGACGHGLRFALCRFGGATGHSACDGRRATCPAVGGGCGFGKACAVDWRLRRLLTPRGVTICESAGSRHETRVSAQGCARVFVIYPSQTATRTETRR